MSPQPLREEPVNVNEAWPIYDTLVMSPVFYGIESQNKGWYTSFQNFAQQETHSFFNSRTEASASLAYCNKQSESMDFAYELNTLGCAFIAPSTRVLAHSDSGLVGLQVISKINTQIAHWWETILPRHCSLDLKVQQDIVSETPCMATPPGYGPVGGGASFEHESIGRQEPQGTATNPDYLPTMNMSVTQGVPIIQNRWSIGKKPIGIPRTGNVEAILTVSEQARYELAKITFDPYLIFGGRDGSDSGEYYLFPARFMIQISMLGARKVQQRGNYFA